MGGAMTDSPPAQPANATDRLVEELRADNNAQRLLNEQLQAQLQQLTARLMGFMQGESGAGEQAPVKPAAKPLPWRQ
eukprot:1793315-Amphidinium_carterae.7